MSVYSLKGKKGIELLEVSSATAATSGYRRLEARSDGWYDIDDAGVETKIQGSVNISGTPADTYITWFSDASTITGTSNLIYDDSSGNVVLTGTSTPQFWIKNDGGSGGAQFHMQDVGSSAEWVFKITNTGAFKIRDFQYSKDIVFIEKDVPASSIYISTSEFVVNDSSGDLDFRVESDTSTHAIFLDAGTNKIGINYDSPTYLLDVYGTATTDAIRTWVGLDLYPVNDPTAPSGVASSGSGLEIGTYYYRVTYTTAIGETGAPVYGTVVTTSGNQQVTLTIPTSTDPRVTGRKIYRTKVGTSNYTQYYLATVADNTTTEYIDSTPDASLTGISSACAFRANTTCTNITRRGYAAMKIDRMETSFGIDTGISVTSGGYNCFFGYQAGTDVTEGRNNNFFGYQSGQNTTTGNYNQAFGWNALAANTTGASNVAIGNDAVFYSSTGSSNIGIGYLALFGKSGTNTSYAVGIGHQALCYALGDYNVAIGYKSMYGNSGGTSTGTNNVAMGASSLYAITTGVRNVSIGHESGKANTTGSYNTFLGAYAGYSNITGASNVFIGYNAGGSETGSNKLYIANSNTSSPLIYGDFNTADILINGAFKTTSGISFPISTITSTTTLTDDYHTVIVDNSGGSLTNRITVTLPTASSHTGRIYIIKLSSIHEYSGSDYGMTLTTGGDGLYYKKGTSLAPVNVDTPGSSAIVQSDGAAWWVLLYNDTDPTW